MSLKSKRYPKKIAKRRLRRDLLELEREKLLSIAARPMDDNIFEWHANIKPNDGVYAGVYFHLILSFPTSYPSKPPKVQIMTPISHPNVFNQFICLSMLREHTGTVPYEGWSGAYSVTSILMQLQSFLFADKIDQDGGYQASAQVSPSQVEYSIKKCKSYHCKCGHSHHRPSPAVQGPPKALIDVFPTNARHKSNIEIDGSCCRTTRNKPVGVYGQYGCNYGKIMYEVFVDWLDASDRWVRTPPYIRFGFGTQRADICGRDSESFGYSAQGVFVHNNNYKNQNKHSRFPSFTQHDTITCAVDFDTKQIYFAKNGAMVGGEEPPMVIPQYLQQKQLLFPLLSMKEARASFNFGAPRKQCAYFIQNGFKTLEQIATEHGAIESGTKKEDAPRARSNRKNPLNWHSKYIINELWVDIFEYLSVQNVFTTQFVCRKWRRLIHKYNIMERGEMYCYFTKLRLGHNQVSNKDKILGIGLNIKESEVGYRVQLNSQMDILSHNAWVNGCRVGVWGEALTHFLPLPMNKAHAEMAYDAMMAAMKVISDEYKRIQMKSYHGKERMENPNPLERRMQRSECLQIVDTLVTMMNQLVAQFVTGNDETDPKSVSMVLCEKVVLGYCALHHLLLYLRSKNKKAIANFANKTIEEFITLQDGPSKRRTRDLGKLLIYLMISTKYEWVDIAARFVEESFTRRIRWFVQNEAYKKYDTTKCVEGRIRDSFSSSKTGRRLVMFQVWFMANNASETLRGYNERLGRPKQAVRDGIVSKTKQILSSQRYTDYFKDLKVSLRNEAAMDQMLRFAVWNSFYNRGYHWNKEVHSSLHYTIYKRVNPPKITITAAVRDDGSRNKSKSKSHVSSVPQNGCRSSKPPPRVQMEEKEVEKVVEKATVCVLTEKKAMISPIRMRSTPPLIVASVKTNAVKMSKAQRRKQRRNKIRNDAVGVGPSRPPLHVSVTRFVDSEDKGMQPPIRIIKDNEIGLIDTKGGLLREMGPTRPPLPCNRFRGGNHNSNHRESQQSGVLSNNHDETDTKLSKAQRRKLRRKNKNKSIMNRNK